MSNHPRDFESAHQGRACHCTPHSDASVSLSLQRPNRSNAKHSLARVSSRDRKFLVETDEMLWQACVRATAREAATAGTSAYGSARALPRAAVSARKIAERARLQARSSTDATRMHARVEHDLYYIENWSLSLDIQILLRTVMSPRAFLNAY